MGTPQFAPLALPPGVFRSGTEYQAKGRWYDCSLVRWYDRDVLGPILGWVSKSLTTVTGSARAIITWQDSSGVRQTAIGTHSKLYAMNSTGTLKDITPGGFTSGRADATNLIGYGAGTYGSGAWGTPRPDSGTILPATVWDLDVFGQYLVCCSHDDGKIYEWQLDFATPTAAAVIAAAPTGCYGLFVMPQRFVIALGAGSNPRKLQWCDQGDETTWAASATNQAGSLEVQQNKLVCGRAVGNQGLILSETEAHVIDYIGLPYVFDRRKVGEACGAISKRCLVSSGPLAAWWSKSGFWIYDGTARPLPCEVWDDLLRNLTTAQQSKVTAFHNARNSEFWWFYPRAGALENTDYVFWSYKYNYWNNGTLSRLCACPDGVFSDPFAVDASGQVWEHEIGYSYSGSTPTARSAPVEIGNGDRMMNVLGIIPDEKTAGDVSVNFQTRPYPNAAASTVGSATFGSSGKADVRFQDRQVELVVTGVNSTNWRWGKARLAVQAAGRR